MMRIITGRARGISLKTLEGEETRPTAERTKEAVFSMLQFDIEGREILDLFAGSGQMGLEAISRGAKNAVLVDKSKNAIKIITENANRTKLSSECVIVNSDCMDYLKQNSKKQFDIVLLDPPYTSGLYEPVLCELYSANMLKQTSIVVCESDKELSINEDIYRVKRIARYGKAVITVLELK